MGIFVPTQSGLSTVINFATALAYGCDNNQHIDASAVDKLFQFCDNLIIVAITALQG